MAVESLNSLPLGFRFRPTDEELVDHYLRLKINGNDKDVRVIREIDVCKVEPWDLPDLSIIPTTDSEWFFFCPRDRKYPNGSRLNRATAAGYWKATGKDRNIKSGTSLIGMKKTLVFYIGRAPKGKRTNWVMHEYRPTLQELDGTNPGQSAYVLCRLFKKQDDTIEDFTGNEVEPTASSPTAAKSSPNDTESDAAINQASPFSGERAENENQNHPPYTDITPETVAPAECDAVEASPLLNVAYEPGSDPIYSPLHSQVQAEFGYSSFNDPTANDFTNNINESEDYISRFLDSVLNSEEEAQFQCEFQGAIFPVDETSRVDHETRAYDLSKNLHMNQDPESSSRSIGDHRLDGASGIIRRPRVVQNPSSSPNGVMQLQGDASRRLKLEKRSQVEAPEACQVSLLVKWFKHVWIVVVLIMCIGVCKFVKF